MTEPVLVSELIKDKYLVLKINREQKRNALNSEVIKALREQLSVANSQRVAAVVITGAGEKAFCAGADLAPSEMINSATNESLQSSHQRRRELPSLFQEMWSSPFPIIACVNGPAIAGGFGLAAACDLIISVDTAYFMASEVKIGLWPFMISLPLLASIPKNVLMELCLTGRKLNCEEALKIGFVNRVAPKEELSDMTLEYLDEISVGSPIALALGKRSFYNLIAEDASTKFDYLASLLSIASQTADAKEGFSAFLEKRQPNFMGQ